MDIEFQLLDIRELTEETGSGHFFYPILFGKTRDAKDVYIKAEGYKPYFLLKIKKRWSKEIIEDLVQCAIDKITYKYKENQKYYYDISEGFYTYSVLEMKQLYGFRADNKFKFIKMEFHSKQALNEFFYLFNKPFKFYSTEYKFKIFEKNIEPHLRFLHFAKLRSCGWVKFNTSNGQSISEESYTDYAYKIHYKHLINVESTDVAPLKILGYDIECVSGDTGFPQPTRHTDKIIQIGLTLYQNGSFECKQAYILTLKKIQKIKNVNVECYKNERGLLMGFANKIREIRPDVICGYNNFIFDDDYIFKRVILVNEKLESKRKHKKAPNELTFEEKFMCTISKLNNYNMIFKNGYKKPFDNRNIIDKTQSTSHFIDKVIQSKAMGDNIFKYFDIPGIISVDLLKVIKKLVTIPSYSLDYVSSYYIKESIKKTVVLEKKNDNVLVDIYTTDTKGLEQNSFIQLLVHDGMQQESLVGDGITVKYKYKVRQMDKKDGFHTIQIKLPESHYNALVETEEAIQKGSGSKIFWSFAKDDVHYTDMNKYFWNYSPKYLKKVAKYCIKDCKLVNILVEKLLFIINNISMAYVCGVPFSYLLSRGQSIKAFMLISNRCLQENVAVDMIKKISNENGEVDEYYEGAEVLDPIPGFYKKPVAVLDYNSLYPSSIIESNLSFETHVDVFKDKYINAPGYQYFRHEIILKDKDKNIIYENGKPKTKINIFAYKVDSEGNIIKGILPSILDGLLKERKIVKNKKTDDPFLKNVYESLQLAFKVVANSLYGQTGAVTSPLYKVEIAETTTFIGRNRLKFAINVVKTDMDAKVIYGDTDSIFVIFNVPYEGTEKDILLRCINAGKKAESLINSKVPKPQKIEFEKIYYRMILVSKKKYTAIKLANNEEDYLKNPNGSISTMGMIQKRRDNAPITKIIAGGLINTLVKSGDPKIAMNYIRTCLEKLVNKEYGLDKFVFSKNLRAKYAKPKSIAHKVLADRMGIRDPGNKPQPGDRIQFVYIYSQSKKKKLQGDKIEHPQYLIDNGLKIDYCHYLLNQIKNPSLQILSLLMKKGKGLEFINQYASEINNKQNNQMLIFQWSKDPNYKIKNVADYEYNMNETLELKQPHKTSSDLAKWVTKGNVVKMSKKKRKQKPESAKTTYKW